MKPECRFKKVACKIWTGTLANYADPNKTPQNTESGQGLHCCLQKVMGKMKQDSVPIQDHFLSLYSETIDPIVLSVLRLLDSRCQYSNL